MSNDCPKRLPAVLAGGTGSCSQRSDRRPAAGDAILIASELATNAIVHSASQGEFFTVRCQASSGHIRIEVEDLGGPWQPHPSGDRPHGLDIIAALTAAGQWGIDGDHAGRTAWAGLTW